MAVYFDTLSDIPEDEKDRNVSGTKKNSPMRKHRISGFRKIPGAAVAYWVSARRSPSFSLRAIALMDIATPREGNDYRE